MLLKLFSLLLHYSQLINRKWTCRNLPWVDPSTPTKIVSVKTYTISLRWLSTSRTARRACQKTEACSSLPWDFSTSSVLTKRNRTVPVLHLGLKCRPRMWVCSNWIRFRARGDRGGLQMRIYLAVWMGLSMRGSLRSVPDLSISNDLISIRLLNIMSHLSCKSFS